jgi:hypothetical protein
LRDVSLRRWWLLAKERSSSPEIHLRNGVAQTLRLRSDKGGPTHSRRGDGTGPGPKGVHVAYIVIDAVIDVPWARERFKTKPDDFFIAPAAIADEAWHVANQPRSAWSFNVEVSRTAKPGSRVAY